MRVVLSYRKATVTALPIYHCELCKAMEYGSIVTLEVDLIGTAQDLRDAIEGKASNVSNTHLPAGWAGYGPTRHRCSKCKT